MRTRPARYAPMLRGSVFAPQRSTPTRSPSSGRYAPERSAAGGAAAPGSTTMRRSSHSARCARLTASSSTTVTRSTNRRAIAKPMSPTQRAPSESAAIPPISVSTGAPCARAAARLAVPSVSTPTTRGSPRNQAAMPPIRPAPPTATSSVSRSPTARPTPSLRSRCRRPSLVDRRRASTGHRYRRVALRRLRAPPHKSGAGDTHVGAVGTQPVDLDLGRALGDEDLGPMTEPARRVRDGEPEVPSGSRDHAGVWDLVGEDPVESPPRLERTGVLMALKLEGDGSWCAERLRLDLEDRGKSDPRCDAPGRPLDVGAANRQ